MNRVAAEDQQMKMVQAFSAKWVDKNVYLHPCSGCKKYGMMLHLDACVICGTENLFYDKTCAVDDSVNSLVFEEVMKIAEVLGEP